MRPLPSGDGCCGGSFGYSAPSYYVPGYRPRSPCLASSVTTFGRVAGLLYRGPYILGRILRLSVGIG